MRSLPSDLTAQVRGEVRCWTHLFKLEWTATHYWTPFERSVLYSNQWYLSKKIDFDSISLSMNPRVDTITITIDDVDRKITNYIVSEDIKDKPITVSLIPLNRNLQAVGAAHILFYGYCDAAIREQGSKDFRITCYNDMIKWKRLTPRRITTPTCIWDFKESADVVLGTDGNNYTCILDHPASTQTKPITGPNFATYWSLAGSGGVTWTEGNWYTVGTCRYAGVETWCDRSWDRCLALGNQINYGGFRFLPGIVGKKIYWGQPSDPTLRAILQHG